MMKLERIVAEIEKTKETISKQQGRLRELEVTVISCLFSPQISSTRVALPSGVSGSLGFMATGTGSTENRS